MQSIPHASVSPPRPTLSLRRQFSSTRRGARLARLRAVEQLDAWGVPRAGRTASAVSAVVAELTANAVTHGRTPGPDFALRLTITPAIVRVEVADTRPDRLPPLPGTLVAPADEEATSGRGLLLVEAFADRWGFGPADPCVKTVWAEFDRQGAAFSPSQTGCASAAGPPYAGQ